MSIEENGSTDESTGVENNQPPPQEDPLKNIKAEFNRKQANLDYELNSIKSQLAEIAQATRKPAAQSQSSTEMPDPVLDPKGYAQAITAAVTQSVAQTNQADQQRQNILSSLVNNYPELQRQDSELTQRAVQIYNQLSPQEKSLPSSYKLAVAEAAQDLGVLPVSKRRSNGTADENFTMNGSSTGAAPKRSQSTNRKDEIDPRTIEFAKLLGKNTDDPKYMEKLKATAKRTSWSKYK